MSGRISQKISICGVTIALIILSLYGGVIIKNNKVMFASFAIIIGCIPYIIGGIKYGIIGYLASVLLAFILIPNILYVSFYVVFGIYPLIKLIAEKKSRLLNVLIKYIWFNTSMLLYFMLFQNIIHINAFFYSTTGKILLITVAQGFFYGFDYIFDLCIYNFINRILKGVK